MSGSSGAALPPLSTTFRDGDVSFWFRDLGGVPPRRPALPGSTDADVVVVGAGLTGLWTAYYLKQRQPDLRVVVLEREFAGFGASGRNGGWLSGKAPASLSRFAARYGHDRAVRFQRAMIESIDEVIGVLERESIDAQVRKDGMLQVARSAAQVGRLEHEVAALRRFGWQEADLQQLTADELAERVVVAGARGATWSPHAARVQPARLVRGLADAVERSGVQIYEGTTVTRVEAGVAHTDHGAVRAPVVITALEGFTAGLPGRRRDWLPMSSSMIVTQPLPADVRDAVRWHGAEVLGDVAHGFAYVQRTEDGRIALGGRAVPYRYGSRWDRRGETMGDTVDQLRAVLARLFPQAADVSIDHAWAGVLGVPRDWCATVGLDRSTGLGWAGGYVGHGVTATNLAGRTLADLVLRQDSELRDMPWVDRKVRRWEPEPLRWIAVRSLYRAYSLADRREEASGAARTSAIATVADRITGR